ncbi:MAG: hypothetical protein QOJ58_4746 [Alphaproteobacteria bacterium]|jgi:hypothetical protein|nr:hypothetical protein [Alphaproteobacteria bacterium]
MLWRKAAPNLAIAGPKGQKSSSGAAARTTTPGYAISNGVRLMFRKITIVLAATAVLSGGLTANAVARAAGHTGWDGLGDGVVSTLARKQQPSERRYDPWGHWGSYYGPMIGHL